MQKLLCTYTFSATWTVFVIIFFFPMLSLFTFYLLRYSFVSVESNNKNICAFILCTLEHFCRHRQLEELCLLPASPPSCSSLVSLSGLPGPARWPPPSRSLAVLTRGPSPPSSTAPVCAGRGSSPRSFSWGAAFAQHWRVNTVMQ